MPDPIAVNKDKKIIKENLKPNRYEFLKKYPALAKIAAPVIYDTKANPIKPHTSHGVYGYPEANLTADATPGPGGFSRAMSGLSHAGGMFARGLGTAAGGLATGIAYPFSPELSAQLHQANLDTYINPLYGNLAGLASAAVGTSASDAIKGYDKTLNAKEYNSLRNVLARTYMGTPLQDQRAAVNEKMLQHNPSQANLYNTIQAGSDLFGDFWGFGRGLMGGTSKQLAKNLFGIPGTKTPFNSLFRKPLSLSRVPGISHALGNKAVANTLLTAGVGYDTTETLQRTAFPNKNTLGEYETPMSVTGLSTNLKVDTAAVMKTWNTGDGPALREFMSRQLEDIPQKWLTDNKITRHQLQANVFLQGHKTGDPTQSVVDLVNTTAGKEVITADRFREEVLPIYREAVTATPAPAEGKPEPGMLDKIQGSLSSYGQGASQALGYGEQYKKLSPMMQAAIPALLAAGGAGLGGYGLYKLFGGGRSDEKEEEEEKTASAYPALAKMAEPADAASARASLDHDPSDGYYWNKPVHRDISSPYYLADPNQPHPVSQASPYNLKSMAGNVANYALQRPMSQGLLNVASRGYNQLPASWRDTVGDALAPEEGGYNKMQNRAFADLSHVQPQVINSQENFRNQTTTRRESSPNSTPTVTRTRDRNNTNRIESHVPGVTGTPLAQLRNSLVSQDRVPSRTYPQGTKAYQKNVLETNYKSDGKTRTRTRNRTSDTTPLPAGKDYSDVAPSLKDSNQPQPKPNSAAAIKPPEAPKMASAYPALAKMAFIGNLLSKFKGKGPVPGDPEFEDKLREFLESRDMLSDPAMQDMLDAGPTLDNSSPGQTASEILGFDPNTVSFKLDDDPSYDFATIDLPDLEEEAKTAAAYPALAKMAAKLPYRERVELYARDPKGRILSGLYSNDRTPGVPGGGVDAGEDPTESAAREFKEEVGHLVRDVQMLDVPTFDQAWKPPYMNKKQKERGKRYSGSRTRFATGVYDPAQKETPIEPWNSKYIMPRKPATMLKGLNLSHDDPDTADRMAARKRAVEEVIRLLSEKTSSYPALAKVAYNPSVQSSAGQFARSAAPPAASKPAGPPMSKLPAEQLAAKLSKEPVGTEVQTTVRDLKSPEYYDPAREKALAYRKELAKTDPDHKWEQYLTPEAGNRKITVRNTDLGAGMGGFVPHDDISLYHQTLEDVRTNGATAKITGPASLIQYNNKFTDDPQAGGDILNHEGTHVMQTPAEGETHITPASEVKWPLINKMMGTIPAGYHKRQRELEGFLSSAKRWNWQQTGQFPETPEEIDEAINRYKASKGGRQFNYPWDKVRKRAPTLQFWNNIGLDPELRKRVHKTWRGVVQNPMQNKTKRAAYPALTKISGKTMLEHFGLTADLDDKEYERRHRKTNSVLSATLLGAAGAAAGGIGGYNISRDGNPIHPLIGGGIGAVLGGLFGGGAGYLGDKGIESLRASLGVPYPRGSYPEDRKRRLKREQLINLFKDDKSALTKSAVIGHAIGGGLGGAYGVAKSDKDNKLDYSAHGMRRGATIGSGSVVGSLLGLVATMALKNKYPSMSSKLHFPAMLAGGVGGGFAGNWLTDKLYGPAPWRVKKIKKKKEKTAESAYPALTKMADKEAEKIPLSTRTKDLQTKIRRLVERYQVNRPWYHFGLGSEKVPGVDIVGQTMDEDYFKRRGSPTGSMVRTEGPDHFGLYPHTIDDEHGTMYEKESAETKSAIAITGLPIAVKPEDFEGISRAEIRRIKEDLPHPLVQALKTGLISASVSGTGQSLLDKKITPRAGQWALYSGLGGGLIGGISQYMDNKRITNALTQALKKQAAHGTVTKQSFSLNPFTTNKPYRKPPPEDEKNKRNRGLSGVFPALGLLSAGALGGAYGLASDARADTIKGAIKGWELPMKPGETAVSRYADTMSQGAQMTPFGVPVPDLLTFGRKQDWLLKLLGLGAFEAHTPLAVKGVYQHYNNYRKGPAAAYAHHMPEITGPVDTRSTIPPDAAPNPTYGKPIWTVSRLLGGTGSPYRNQIPKEFHAELQAMDTKKYPGGYPEAIKPYFDAAWQAFKDKKFPDDQGSPIAPHEIDTKLIPHKDQIQFLRDFHARLQKEAPALAAFREVHEGTGSKGRITQQFADNYKDKVLKPLMTARDIAKTVGYTSGGAAAGGALGHYLNKWFGGEDKDDTHDWSNTAATTAGTALGGGLGYALSSPDANLRQKAKLVGGGLAAAGGAYGVYKLISALRNRKKKKDRDREKVIPYRKAASATLIAPNDEWRFAFKS